MKKSLLLTLLVLIFLPFMAMSQLTCGDAFNDNGGPTSNYLANSNEIQTICSAQTGEQVTVYFNAFDVEVNYDGLYVYDGNSIAAPQLASNNGVGDTAALSTPGAFWGTILPGPFTSSNANGCLTFKFVSDATVNKSGWQAQVECSTSNNCISPTNVQVGNVNLSSATLTWTESNSATEWEIIVLPATASTPSTDATGIAVNGTSNYTVTELSNGTSYKAYIRSLCTTTEKSFWRASSIFTTLTCAVPTGLSANSINQSGATLTWANNSTSSSQWEVIVLPSSSPVPTVTSTGILTATNSYAVNNLISNTTYKFYVRLICSSSSKSTWSSSYSFTPFITQPPLTVNSNQYTPAQLVTDVLINNPCVQVSNVTSLSGATFGEITSSIGYFTNTNPTFPLTSGIVLSTGSVASIPGPNTTVLSEGSSNWPGDAQLESIILAGTGTTMVSRNATKLEFDFSSLNEFMSFNFLFASDEYGTFQCEFADAFAFLLTDITTGITTNIAVVPSTTTPISVVTIRDNAFNSSCASVNANFFDQYFDGNLIYTSATNFNGQTHVMTASSPILPNNPYHVKLVIADRADTAYDSAVFIQEGSFTTGPPECVDKIRLISFVDENNNGIKDTNENEFTFGNFTVENDETGALNTIISPLGMYTIYATNAADAFNFSYNINPEYATYYSTPSTTYNSIAIVPGSGTTNYYFPVTLIQSYNDLTVSISGTTAPRTGTTYKNKIVYKNLGVTPASGIITFNNDPQVTIMTISQTGTVPTTTGFTYNFNNLAPYETRMIEVTMSVPAIPVVNIDDLLTNSVSIASNSGDSGSPDIDLNNNAFSNTQVVVAAYDPNDKMESHGGKIQHDLFTSNDYLYYTIRFQNNGTANAINVRIEDVLDSRIDEQSLRMISASHNYILERNAGNLTWYFDYIQLAPYTIYNEAASRGYVTFKVKLKPGFAVGDIIPNTAGIYFDSNPAIITNTFNTQFVQSLGTTTFTASDLVLYPNPASNFVQISLQNSTEQIKSITVFDVLGKRILEHNDLNTNQTTINTSALSKGMYLIEIKSDTNLKLVKKLIIQ